MKSGVLITGGAGALGRAFAAECAERGWDLILTDIDAAGVEDVARGLSLSCGVRVDCYVCDLTDEPSRAAFYEELESSGMRVWMLINVAGLDFEGGVCERKREELRTIVKLNVESTLETTHAMIELRDRRRPFRVITVASLAAFYPMPLKATYAASKAFLLQFSLALNEELRSLGGSATALCPAGMPTRADVISSIESQGLMGRVSTVNTGKTAAMTIDSALKGKTVVVPGLVNRILRVVSSLIPPTLLARLIGSRWKSARSRVEPSVPLREERGLLALPVGKSCAPERRTPHPIVVRGGTR